MIDFYTPISAFWDKMTEENRAKALDRLPDIKGLLCYTFPYLAEKRDGNISLYARGRDYHKVVGAKLLEYCRALSEKYPQNSFIPYVDVSPFPEVYAAAASGLGKLGKNGLLITEKYGSFVFIGVIATNLELEQSGKIEGCIGCNRCVSACPTRALAKVPFNKDSCLSEITQKKGELSSDEKALMKRQNTAWGCDICQLVCPMNEKAAKTDIAEFETELIESLYSGDLQESNKTIQKKYADRAFIWRGGGVLRRNTEILEKDGE